MAHQNENENIMNILEAFKFVCAHVKALAIVERNEIHSNFKTYYTTDGFRLIEPDLASDKRELQIFIGTRSFTVESFEYDSCLIISANASAEDLIDLASKIHADQALTIAKIQRANLAQQIDKMLVDLNSTATGLITARKNLMESSYV